MEEKTELTEDDMKTLAALDSSITKMWAKETYFDEKYGCFLYEAFKNDSYTSMAFLDRRTRQAYIVEYIPDNYPSWSGGNIPTGQALLRILRNLRDNDWEINLKGLCEKEKRSYFGVTERQVLKAAGKDSFEE